jgi:hypothetical protein
MKLLCVVFAFLVAIGATSNAFAQQQIQPPIHVQDTQIPSDPGVAIDAVQPNDALKFRANFQLILTGIVTVFGVLSLVLVALIFKQSIASEADKIVRLVIVVIVVSASLILITAGYSNQQIAPAFGLFGTIIGYILGSSGRKSSSAGNNQPVNQTDDTKTNETGG